MKQLNNQNNIFLINDMKENLSNNLINQKNFIMNLNTIIDINSSGIRSSGGKNKGRERKTNK